MNILVNDLADTILGDFGAASFYDVNLYTAANIERVEVRAYACLIEDLLGLVKDVSDESKSKWQQLINDCRHVKVKSRPGFSEILERLKGFKL